MVLDSSEASFSQLLNLRGVVKAPNEAFQCLSSFAIPVNRNRARSANVDADNLPATCWRRSSPQNRFDVCGIAKEHWHTLKDSISIWAGLDLFICLGWRVGLGTWFA